MSYNPSRPYASMRLRGLCSAVVLLAGMGLFGCSFDTEERRLETTKRIANPAFLLHREVAADPFIITVFERVHQRGKPANIYIEGDGVAWVSKSRPSLDPTPRNPVALHLAAHDPAVNVIYIARPCQYSGMLNGGICDPALWTMERFSPAVISSMNAVIDNIRSKYGITDINLVGFSGGGAVATLLAAARNDVVTLRTVAGNLDHVALNNMHGVSQMPDSLNPADVAPKLARMPQHHFIGEWDEVVTPAIYDSFRAAAGESTCMRSSIATKVDHEDGWVNIWPQALGATLDCNKTDGAPAKPLPCCQERPDEQPPKRMRHESPRGFN